MIVAIEVLKHALIITLFVFVMMVLVDYINVMTRDSFLSRLEAVNGGSISWHHFLEQLRGASGHSLMFPSISMVCSRLVLSLPG